MNPTLYDVLGIPRDASREEIRTAWRDAADRFEPGEGGSTKQFRLFNEAAEVLLDPERRKAYDAQLEAGAATEEGSATVGSATEDKAGDLDEEPTAEGPVPTPPVPGAARAVTPSTSPPIDIPADGEGSGAGRLLPWWVLAVLGVLTAVAVGLAAYFVTQAQRTADYREALDRAPAAAESAASAVLSYDHETLEADRDAAAKFLTDEYRSDYVETFDKLVVESATETRATVEAEVLASSAMVGGSERDPDRVPVLLFVNQTTTNTAGSGEPSVALNRVRLDMVNVDGAWLVDGITSY
ncbi:MAG TPA: J domain-containing protein [Nocardioidaceae bacterium]|nr:J domain-containing protein [Nocardioidaceae bacterium]